MALKESVSGSLILRSELPTSGIVAVDVVIDGEPEAIIVHCQDQAISAWLNVCPHQGRRLDYAPGKFLIDKGQLVCAAHGATFRLDDGICVAGPCRGSSLRAVAVREGEGEGEDGALRFGPLL